MLKINKTKRRRSLEMVLPNQLLNHKLSRKEIIFIETENLLKLYTCKNYKITFRKTQTQRIGRVKVLFTFSIILIRGGYSETISHLTSHDLQPAINYPGAMISILLLCDTLTYHQRESTLLPFFLELFSWAILLASFNDYKKYYLLVYYQHFSKTLQAE